VQAFAKGGDSEEQFLNCPLSFPIIPSRARYHKVFCHVFVVTNFTTGLTAQALQLAYIAGFGQQPIQRWSNRQNKGRPIGRPSELFSFQVIQQTRSSANLGSRFLLLLRRGRGLPGKTTAVQIGIKRHPIINQ
jgi:hypothetical protein